MGTLSLEKKSTKNKTAVLIDGSALFQTVRDYYEGYMDYRVLVTVLTDRFPWLNHPSHDNPWIMWTSISPGNTGQERFLKFLENDVNFIVRSLSPYNAYIVEPGMISTISSDHPIKAKLIQFDSKISFALGRLSTSGYRCVIVSPSFQMAQPLQYLSEYEPDKKPVLAYFGQGLDPRMFQLINNKDRSIEYLDLHSMKDTLFPNLQMETKKVHHDFLF